MEYLKYNFINRNFRYSLFFQEYFKNVRNISEEVEHREHDEYTAFFNASIDFVPKDKKIIDVGANSGLFCIPICMYGYEVIAFEPVKSNIKCIELGIESNNLKNLTISPYALSNENVVSKIYVPNSQDNASLIEEVSCSNLQDKSYSVEEVQCYKLDDYILDNNIDPKSIGLVKIDVQGYELQVVEGMVNLLKNSENLTVILEWDPFHSGEESLKKMVSILNDFSFKEINYPGIVVWSAGNKIYRKL